MKILSRFVYESVVIDIRYLNPVHGFGRFYARHYSDLCGDYQRGFESKRSRFAKPKNDQAW
jgi:hypothetical protein